jgi:5-methylcytosine-specific restriction endonuclease McrA
MRLEIFILGLTAFFVYNTYHDGKYTKMLWSFRKYYTMIFYVVLGVGILLILRRNPHKAREFLLNTNNMIKYLPIDKDSADILSPIINLTNHYRPTSIPTSINDTTEISYHPTPTPTPTLKQYKRSVSETKKKYVAYRQEWKCNDCQQQLDHTFEIDHKIRLEYGGDNEVGNLVALCRNCHGKKTAKENM